MGKHCWEKVNLCIHMQLVECAKNARPWLHPGHFSCFAVKSLKGRDSVLSGQRAGLLIACYESRGFSSSLFLSHVTQPTVCAFYIIPAGLGQGDLPQICWGLLLTLSLIQESCVFCPHPRNRNRLTYWLVIKYQTQETH